ETRDPHSFPTRRSSDLTSRRGCSVLSCPSLRRGCGCSPLQSSPWWQAHTHGRCLECHGSYRLGDTDGKAAVLWLHRWRVLPGQASWWLLRDVEHPSHSTEVWRQCRSPVYTIQWHDRTSFPQSRNPVSCVCWQACGNQKSRGSTR